MTDDQSELQLLRQESLLLAQEKKLDAKKINNLTSDLKVAHKFIKMIAAFCRMQAPMHYMRTCKCEICDLCRQARRITGP
jgi:hypothetical protein